MKQLPSSKPLCYMLPNSDLVTALPYIDDQIPQFKNKIQYLIKQSQQNIEYNEQKYLHELQLPVTPFINSNQFEIQVERIKNKKNQKKAQIKDKKLVSTLDQINLNMLNKNKKMREQDEQKFRKSIINYENNLLKQINLQISQKFAPEIQKQLIVALDRKKQLLEKEIQQEKTIVQQINKQRQYQQLQDREREQTVRDRLRVMIHKRKKID